MDDPEMVRDNAIGPMTHINHAIHETQLGALIDHVHVEEIKGHLMSSDNVLGLVGSTVDLRPQYQKLSSECLRIKKKNKKGRRSFMANKKKHIVSKKNYLKQRMYSKRAFMIRQRIHGSWVNAQGCILRMMTR